MERIPGDRREEWDRDLLAPIPGQEDRPTEAMVEIEGADFMATMAMHEGMTSAGPG